MTKRGVAVLVLGLCLAGAAAFVWTRAPAPVSAPASGAPASASAVAEPCRESPYEGLEEGTGEERSLYVSGDRNVDVPGVEIDVEMGSGSALAWSHVTLHDP